MKRSRFKIDIFNATVHMYIVDTDDDILKHGNKVIKRFGEEPIDFPCHGLTFTPDQRGDTYYIFLSKESMDINTICHETDHIRNYIIDYYDIDQASDSDEISANLSGYINQKVFSFIKKLGIEIK